jgi:hypothetical protein
MNLAASWELDSVETVESGKERVGVVLDVVVIVFEDRPQKLVLGVADGLDDVLVVAREVEEGARFSGRAELREDIFGREGEEVVGWIESEVVLHKDNGSAPVPLSGSAG